MQHACQVFAWGGGGFAQARRGRDGCPSTASVSARAAEHPGAAGDLRLWHFPRLLRCARIDGELATSLPGNPNPRVIPLYRYLRMRPPPGRSAKAKGSSRPLTHVRGRLRSRNLILAPDRLAVDPGRSAAESGDPRNDALQRRPFIGTTRPCGQSSLHVAARTCGGHGRNRARAGFPRSRYRRALRLSAARRRRRGAPQRSVREPGRRPGSPRPIHCSHARPRSFARRGCRSPPSTLR
jgi:hypothetical protein